MESIRSSKGRLVQWTARAALALVLGGLAATSYAQTYPSQPQPQPRSQPQSQQQPQSQPQQQQPQPQADAFRAEVAAPLKAAEELIRAGKFDDALAKIRETDAIPNRSPTENVTIERMRGIAASGAGDIPTAIRSFEAVIAAGPADKAKMQEVLAQLYFQAKDYPKAASLASRYLTEGGPNADVRWLMIRAQYLAGDCVNAARELRALVDAEAKSGAPNQERLQMLASCYTKQGDDAGFAYTLDKFLAYYPTQEYWAEAIRRVERKPGFSERNTLDVLRLQRATGTFGGTDAYVAMTQRSMTAGLPAEAKRIFDEGFASGALGTGAGAEAQKRLRDAAAKQVQDDQKQLPQSAKAAVAASGGVALVNVGFAYVSGGQFDTGIPMMEQGIARGGLPRPDEARLHLGIAYLSAGKKAEAIKAFREVGGTDGTAELARLWLIYAQRPTS
jgi:tetratricopeptide (TPR) repeat protein